jgi:hypothetical protein
MSFSEKFAESSLQEAATHTIIIEARTWKQAKKALYGEIVTDNEFQTNKRLVFTVKDVRGRVFVMDIEENPSRRYVIRYIPGAFTAIVNQEKIQRR